jgi:hypothetical protein
VIAAQSRVVRIGRWIWWLVYLLLALYVAARMSGFALWADVSTADGIARLPNTYASVDHPFHVARAESLWRELSAGRLLRWVGHHQGGYPVEFYPLGVPWLETALRALSLGSLRAEGAHTLAIITLFLLPGVAFAALAREDGWPPAVGLLALTLHVALPGGSFDGGYTELVQWGLVTNVGGAVASILMLPALVRFLATGSGWAGAAAATFAAAAVYANPRSLLGLAALAVGALLASRLRRTGTSSRALALRMALVASTAALLSAPEWMALLRFSDLYQFVHYNEYAEIGDYLAKSVRSVTGVVFALAVAGCGFALFVRERVASTSAALTLAFYALMTATVAFVPIFASQTAQLEATRLMPLQRLLTLYLAAVAVWAALTWLWSSVAPRHSWVPAATALVIATVVMFMQTRPLPGPLLDPASPAVPPVSLYPVTMSAVPAQADLAAAVRAADASAAPGTAMLVLGSRLSWHQQLWAPLWTTRPLFYDNWLWYWHPHHAGTPEYVFRAGHHYPDPERAIDRDYLERHGIGAVVVGGSLEQQASASPWLRPLGHGSYRAYLVRDPVTTVTFGDENAATSSIENQRIDAASSVAGAPVTARINWHPRWEVWVTGSQIDVQQRGDGYLAAAPNAPVDRVALVYTVQPADWLARGCAIAGIAAIGWLAARSARECSWRRWYDPGTVGDS